MICGKPSSAVVYFPGRMDQLIVALDVDQQEEAVAIAEDLRGLAGAFKIGSRLFTTEGPAIVQELGALGHRVFLDLKFHDIPETVAGAVGAAARLDVWMLTVHASGGAEMIRAARRAAEEHADGGRPLIVAVTILTSIGEPALGSIGVAPPLDAQVLRLAHLARDAGADGIVASPHEARAVRAACGDGFTIVTPGIRHAGGGTDDQARVSGPAAALAAGADYLVVGRPILRSPNRRAAAERIVADMRSALGASRSS
jgi:orotidine-5'-phosphate decarboxylase